MEYLNKDLLAIKNHKSIDRLFVFGSSVNNPSVSNDIDIILFSEKENQLDLGDIKFTYPIKRVQYNCYKKQDCKDMRANAYDIVVINNDEILGQFIKRNAGRIIEV